MELRVIVNLSLEPAFDGLSSLLTQEIEKTRCLIGLKRIRPLSNQIVINALLQKSS